MPKKKIQLKVLQDAFNDSIKRNQEISTKISEIINTPSLQSYLKEVSKMNKAVSDIMESLRPTFNFGFKSTELAESLSKSFRLMEHTKMPKVENTRVLISQPQKKYTEDDVENIIKKTIVETMKTVGKNPLLNKPILPDSITWEDIVIKFKDGHNVQILADKVLLTANFKEMGFEDSNQLKPNHQWIFLKALASTNGEICWRESQKPEKTQKIKQLLAKGLKNYFGLKDDPFTTHRRDKIYQIRFKLLPESESISLPADAYELKNDDKFGIDDYFDEITRPR